MSYSKSSTAPSEMISVSPKTPGQQRLVDSIRNNVITLVMGGSGNGKSLLSIYEALQFQKKQEVREILYTKAIVDFPSLQGIGYLPGNEEQKLEPLLWPVRDNLKVFCGDGLADYIIRKKKIEPVLLQDLRGRSLSDTFLIFDEAQNVPPEIIQMVLTRIGDRAKVVIAGDYMQKDSSHRFKDGLSDAMERLRDIPEVGIVEMSWEDCVRAEGLPSRIQQRYNS
jgi:phosphate starvation-inducible protein PhoH and related proteins